MIPLIITGTICSVERSDLKLTNSEERLNQYKESLGFFIKSRTFKRIVFGENSGFFLDNEIEATELCELAREYDVELDIHCFRGNSDAVSIHGKGYGEGEIMKHIFENAVFDENDSFLKVTGRLKVDNVEKLVAQIKKNHIYFNVPNSRRREFFDTRLYSMPIGIFKENFMDSFVNVNDSEGHFLEHVYTDIVRENHFKTINFPVYPRIVGISGTSGITYSYSEPKAKIKDLLSALNYYGKLDH